MAPSEMPPEAVARTVRRSRIAEAVAVLTVVSTMLAALAAMVTSISHDRAAVRIAEAQRRCVP